MARADELSDTLATLGVIAQLVPLASDIVADVRWRLDQAKLTPRLTAKQDIVA